MLKPLALILAAAPALAQTDPSNMGETYWQSITCGAITANLMINHRSVSQPTLFMNDTPIPLPDGPNYAGPVCVTFRGKPYVGFTEYMGNAYEIYRLIDLDTFAVQEITYQQAEKIWPW
ncbi:MAG: hypothetical protein WCC57_08815 [Paracoccaceae bacterium]